MPQVTYNGERPVVTPTLDSGGNTDLGLWEPGQTKDVPEELLEGLCSEGSAFSSSGSSTPEQDEEAPAEAESEQKPSSSGGLFRRG